MASAVPVPTPGSCAEKQRLLYHYGVAASEYSRAVVMLSERVGVMTGTRYARVRNYSEIARATAEAARHELDQHVAKHGC